MISVYLHHSGVDYPEVFERCSNFDAVFECLSRFSAAAVSIGGKVQSLGGRVRIVFEGQEDNPFFVTWEEKPDDE